MRIANGVLLAMLALLLSGAAAAPKQWEVRMANSAGNGTLMVFDPGYLAIRPGDSVKFVAADKGHNAESIAGMAPAGAAPFRGRINEEIVVTFAVPGLYAVKCLPHFGMGMVALIQVGAATNKAQIAAAANALPAAAKARISALLAQVR
ncbi:MAG: pseudoazurin [Sphingomonas sp.]